VHPEGFGLLADASIHHTSSLDFVGTDATIESHELNVLMAYWSSPYFWIPPWQSGQDDQHYLGRSWEIVTMHKDAVVDSNLVARLSHVAWFLLNGCTVRFLARGDRRFLH